MKDFKFLTLLFMFCLTVQCKVIEKKSETSSFETRTKARSIAVEELLAVDWQQTIPSKKCKAAVLVYADEDTKLVHPCPRLLEAYLVGNVLFPQVGYGFGLLVAAELMYAGDINFDLLAKTELNEKQKDVFGRLVSEFHRMHSVKYFYKKSLKATVDRERGLFSSERISHQFFFGFTLGVRYYAQALGLFEDGLYKADITAMRKNVSDQREYDQKALEYNVNRAAIKSNSIRFKQALFSKQKVLSKEAIALQGAGRVLRKVFHSVEFLKRSQVYRTKLISVYSRSKGVSSSSVDAIAIFKAKAPLTYLKDQIEVNIENSTYPRITRWFLKRLLIEFAQMGM